MKKRVLALILAIMMVVTNIAPSFASLGEDDSGQNEKAQSVMDGANAIEKKESDNEKNGKDDDQEVGGSPIRLKNDGKLKSSGTNPKATDSKEETSTSLQSTGKQSYSTEVKESSYSTSSGDNGGEEGDDSEEKNSDTSDEEDNDKENEEFPYIGYQEGQAGVARKLYVENKDDSNVRRVVYCFNKTLHWPDPKDSPKGLYYTKTTGSADDFKDKVHQMSKYKGQVLIDKLKVVLLNGYPNGNRIQNSLGLTNDQMQGITQMAVWHFTDNAYTKRGDFQSLYTTKEALALALLINMAGAEETLGADVLNHYENEYKKTNDKYERPEPINIPADSTLDLYIQNGAKQSDNKGYQNLLGAFLIDKYGQIIEIENDEETKDRKKVGLVKTSDKGQLEGAEFEIAKADAPDTIIKNVTSSADGAVEFELEVGLEYIVKETLAPEGYQKISGIKFKVTSDGEIEVTDVGKFEDKSTGKDLVYGYNNKLFITDKEKTVKPDTGKKTKVIIRKYSKGDYKKLLVGAELELYKISDDEKEGTLVGDESFTSDSKGKEFALTDGSYILKEKNAPEGYNVANDINFEVKEGRVLIDGKEAPMGLENPFSYEAYSNFNDDGEMVANNPYGKFYYMKKSGQDQVVYCFNATKHAPAESYDDGGSISYEPQYGEVKYNKVINPAELYKYAQNPRIASAELATKVTRIINAGYPNNGAGIDNIGLTNTQLRAATQLAIYYYTDSADLTDEGLEKLGDGFQFLKGNEETESKIKAYAQALINYAKSGSDGFSFDFYVANNGHYQNLIGTSYDPSDLHYVIAMEDESETGTTEPGTPTPEPDKPKSANIFFSKQDVLGNELEGAHLQIIDKSTNEVIEEWVSDGSTQTFKLNEGSYKLVETAAPEGYQIATEINFEVDKDGKVTADEGSLKTIAGNNVIVMEDDYKDSHIFFSKQDILGKELPGAKLQIKDKAHDKVVKEWTSGESPETFGLKPGKYEFAETAAPKGYKIATAIDFEITKDGEIKADSKSLKTVGSSNILVMVDDYKESKIFFSKQDILGKELAGAKLQIKDKKTGEVVKEWTSGESPETFGLKPGNYEFVEKAAPKGYKIATSIDFEITKDGEIVAKKESLKKVGSSNILVMVDDYKDSHIFFSKRDILDKELPGAKLQIKDKETGKIVEEWISGETPNTFGLKPGSYEFVETAAPKGYKIATSIDFEITIDGEIKADANSLKTIGTGTDETKKSKVLVMVDDYETSENPNEDKPKEKNTNIFFSKRDILGKELAGAKLKIKDNTTGIILKEWTSGTTPSTFGFKPGKYQFVETAAPKGYKIATAIDFEITKDGEIVAKEESLKTVGSSNILVMVDEYETSENPNEGGDQPSEKEKNTNIFFSKRDILGKELAGAKLQIKDKTTGRILKEWISGTTPSTFGFKPGKYQFVETAAPKGYKIATAIDFEITKDGEIKADAKSLKTVGSSNILVMVDEYEKSENPKDKEENPKDKDGKPKDKEDKPSDKNKDKSEKDKPSTEEKDKTTKVVDKDKESKEKDKDSGESKIIKEKELVKEKQVQTSETSKDKPQNKENLIVRTLTGTPKTGVTSNLAFYSLAIISSSIGLYLTRKKK